MKKSISILPADIYVVINKTKIDNGDIDIVSKLYQPIIGFTAVSLYISLINDLRTNEFMSEEYTHHHLMTKMQLSLDEIVMAREKLEGVGLLKSYLKKNESVNNYAYLLFSPLSANEFLNHPILNVVLYNNLGKREYEKVVSEYKIPRISLKDYEDITKSFSTVYKGIPSSSFGQENIIKKEKNNLLMDKSIDFDYIIAGIPKSMLNEKCFNSDVKRLINYLVFTYNISQEDMLSLIRDSLNEKGMIDKTLLRKNCRNYYQFDNGGFLPTLVYRTQPDFLKKPQGDTSNWAKMVYTFENVSPYDYLKAMYKGTKPTARDLRLIESLLVDQNLSPGVVNVLISYVLKVNNQKLSKNYVETIVGQWKRLNVETVEEAMRITEKEHKKMHNKDKKKNTKVPDKTPVPEWFDKKIDSKELSAEEEEEIDKILESIA